jgi:predicted RNA-binding protein with PUA-like domain
MTKPASTRKTSRTRKSKATPTQTAPAKTKSKSKSAGARPPTATALAQAAALAGIRCWVVKSEPFVYSFDQLVADRATTWEGVRNFEARNTLRAMKLGDTLLYYHSNEGLALVGIAKVARTAYPDPTQDKGEDWTAIDVAPVKKLEKPVSLATLKAHPLLSKMALVKKSRISVTPVTEDELRAVLALAKTSL